MSKLYQIPISETQRRATEINNRTDDAIKKLNADLSAEVTNRTNADDNISQRLTTLKNTVDDAVSSNTTALDNVKSDFNNKIDAESAARQNADANINSNLNNEIDRAKQAESALTQKINTDIGGVNSTINNEITRAKTAENDLNTAFTQKLEQEQRERALADVDNTTRAKALVETETSERKAAIKTLSDNLADEITNRTKADNNLQTAITTAVAPLAPKANPTFTGTVKIPAAAANSDSLQAANVGFVNQQFNAVNNKLVVFQKATATADGKQGFVPVQSKTDKRQVLTSDGWMNMDAAGMTVTLPTQLGTLTYNGNSQSPDWNNYDASKMTMTVTEQTNAGTYKAKFTPTGLYVWSDTNKQTEREVEWTINPLLLPKPSASVKEFTFNNANQGITVANFDSTYESQSGTVSASDASTYTATYSLKNTNNTKWSDGSVANVNIQWQILVRKIAKPSATNALGDSGVIEFDYDKATHAPTVVNFDTNYINRTGTYSTADAGDYTITFSIKQTKNVHWADDSIANVNIPWKIIVRELTIPTFAVDNFTFSYANNSGTGTTHTVTINNYDARFMTKSGTESASDAGVYSVTFTLNDEKYKWADKTTAAKTVTFTINRAAVDIPTLTSETVTYNGGNIYISTKEYGNNFLRGCASNTSKFAWTTALGTGLTASGMQAYAKNVGNYSFTITLNNNHCWKGKTGTEATKALTYTWNIARAPVAVPELASDTAAYTGANIYIQMKTLGQSWLTGNSSWTTALGTGITKSGEKAYVLNSGEYSFTITPDSNHCWTGGAVDTKTFVFTVTKKLAAVPTISGGGDFKNANYTITWSGFDSSLMTKTGTETAKNAGTYSVTVSLKTPADYEWSGLGHSEPITLQWKINRAKLTTTQSNLYQATPFTYTGNTFTFTPENYDANYHILGGTLTGKDAGTYYATADVNENYLWSDGTSDQKTIEWQVNKDGTIVKPTAATKSYYYTASNTTITISNYNQSYMTRTGTVTAKDVGSYEVRFALIDKDNFTWADGKTDDVVILWEIVKRTVAKPVISTKTFTYNGNSRAPSFTAAFATDDINLSGDTAKTDAGNYNIVCSLKDKVKTTWTDGTTDDITFAWVINRKKLTATQSNMAQSGSFTFDGTEKTLAVTNFNSDYHTLSGDVKKTEAGTYTALVTPTKNYAWSNGGTTAKSVSWTIAVLVLTKPEVTSATAFTFDNKQHSLTFSSYNTTWIQLTGDSSAVDENSYTCTFALKNKKSTRWLNDDDDNDTANIKILWSISKRRFTKPYATKSTLTFSVTATVSPTISGFNSSFMTREGDLNNDYKAGDFSITYALKDKSLYLWDDGTTADVVVNWTVDPLKLSYDPKFESETSSTKKKTYTGAAVSDKLRIYYTTGSSYLEYNKDGYSSTTNATYGSRYIKSVTGDFVGTDVGVYSATVELLDTATFADGSRKKTVSWQIKPKIITAPTVSTENILTFNGTTSNNGTAQNVQLVGFDSETMTLGGQTSGIDAGSYIVQITPKANWCWSSGAQTPISLYWHINEKPLSATNSNLHQDNDTVYFSGDTTAITLSNSSVRYHTFDSSRPAGDNKSNIYLKGSLVYKDKLDVYTCKNFCFNDGSVHKSIPIKWTPITANTWYLSLSATEFAYDGKEHSVTVKDIVNKYMRITEDSVLSATEEGFYCVKVELKTEYTNPDGTIVNIKDKDVLRWWVPDPTCCQEWIRVFASQYTKIYLYWTIGKKIIDRVIIPEDKRVFAYTGNVINPNDLWQLQSEYFDVRTFSAIEKGLYEANILAKKDVRFNDGKANMLLEYVIGDESPFIDRDDAPTITSDTEFDYDGTEKSITLSAYDGTRISVSGKTAATDAGTYTFTVSPRNSKNYWNDGTKSKITYTWKIKPQTLESELSTFHQKTVLFYDGKNKTVTLTGYNATYHTLAGTTKAIECGTYIAKVRTKANYCFQDGSTTKDVEWSIIKTFCMKPRLQASTFSYTGSAIEAYTEFDSTTATVTLKKGTSVVTNCIDVGSYSATFTLKDKDNTTWQDGTTDDVVLNFSITPMKLTKPKLKSGTMTYNGNSYDFLDKTNYYKSDYMTAGGQTSGVDAGSYTATFTLKNTANTTWSDGSTGVISVTYTIAKAKLSEAMSTPTFKYSTVTLVGSKTVYIEDNHYNQSNTIYCYISLGDTPITKRLDQIESGAVHPELVTVGGTWCAKNVGNYTATLTPSANYTWADGTTTAKSVNWSIEKRLITIPYISGDSSFEYDGNSHSINIVFDGIYSSKVSGSTSATNAGTYTVTYKVDTRYAVWEDGTSANKSVSWSILVNDFDKPSISGTLTYTGNAQSPTIDGFNSTFMETSSQTSMTNAGTYTVVVKLKDKTNCKWADGTTADVSLKWTINRKSTGVSTSTALAYTTLTYNGSDQTVSPTSHKVDYFTYTGTTKGKNAGTYTITVTPKANYCWSDGTTAAKSLNWVINKASAGITATLSTFTINNKTVDWSKYLELKAEHEGSTFPGFKGIYLVSKKSPGTLMAKTENIKIYAFRPDHSTKEVSPDTFGFYAPGTSVITYYVNETDNYLYGECQVTINLNLTFEDLSWDCVRCLCSTGNIKNFAQVGDTKTISGDVKATVIGFDHNYQIESPLKSTYADKDRSTVSSFLYFERVTHFAVFNSGLTGKMNDTATNSGGWKESKMRAYLNDTYLKSLPADLQAVIKAVDKYTDNVGGDSTPVAANVTVTKDKIWLLNSYEYYASNSASCHNTAEDDFSEQYEYFANGNTGKTGHWWLRSPMRRGAFLNSSFAAVKREDSTSNFNYRTATENLAIVPCFVIG